MMHLVIIGPIGWFFFFVSIYATATELISNPSDPWWPAYVAAPGVVLLFLYMPLFRTKLDDEGFHSAGFIGYQLYPYEGIASYRIHRVSWRERLIAMTRSGHRRTLMLGRYSLVLHFRSGGSLTVPVRKRIEVARLLDYYIGGPESRTERSKEGSKAKGLPSPRGA